MYVYILSILIGIVFGLSILQWYLITKNRTVRGKPMPVMDGSIPLLFNIPILMYHNAFKNDFYPFMIEQWKKKGRVFTFHRPGGGEIVALNDAELLQELMSGQRSRQTLVRSSVFQKNMHSLLGEGIFNTEVYWEDERKRMSRMFKLRDLMAYQDRVFAAHAKELQHVLDASVGQTIDMQDLAMRFTLDAGMEIFYGVPSDSVQRGTTPYSAAFNTAQLAANKRFSFFFWPLLPTAWLPSEVQLRDSLRVLDDFFYATIDARLQESDLRERKDLLSMYLASSEVPDRTKARDMMANILVAARDTTSMAFIFAVYLLSKNPKALAATERELERIRQECDDGVPSFELMRKNKYLDAVVYETLRLYPPVPFDGLAVSEDIQLGSGALELKKGNMIQYSPLLLGQDPGYWGEDALEFKPERWFGEDVPKQGQFPFVPWNAGKRVCLGKDFSIAELKTMLYATIPHYKFTVMEEPVPIPAITMMCDKGMKMKIERK